MTAAKVAAGLGIAAVLATSASAARARCQERCGYRIAQCVLARGGVDGSQLRECTRGAVAACQQRGRRVCPFPTRDELVATLAQVQAVEATVHDPALCAAIVPDVPATSIDDAIAAGRDAASALAGTTDPTLHQSGGGFRGGAFGKLFLQGFSGHGAAFIPLGDVVVAMARPSRSVSYATDTFGSIVHGVVGTRNGRALGVLLTYCP